MKRKGIFFISSLVAFTMLVATKQAHTIDSAKVWMKIRAADKFERSKIADMGIAIDAVSDGYVYATGNEVDRAKVAQLGLLDLSFLLTDQIKTPVDRGYRDYGQVTQELKNLATSFPSITNLSSIGKSTDGRDIWSLRISGNLAQADSLPAVVYLGGHHAREHLSVELPLRYARKILEAYAQNDARIVSLVNSRDIHFIPAVNPDGLEFDIEGGKYHMWRKNRSKNGDGTFGTDLNRNYGFHWGTGGSSKDTSSDVFMGPAAFSAPETRAIKNYVEAHNNITILLSFHTFSELVLYPWGHKYDGIETTRDKAVHETMAQKMAQWNHYTPEQSSSLYIASGDTTDWSYGEHKIISFTFELDPTSMWDGGFYPGSQVIPNVMAKNWEPILYLLSYADNPYRSIDSKNSYDATNLIR